MESNFHVPKGRGRGRGRRSREDISATRAVRFSFEENCALIDKVCEYYQEIVGSATAKTPQRKKNELWRRIVDAVNAVGGNNRTELVVKKRYFDVKRQLKKKLCKAASHTETGDEKSEDADLTSYEEELLQVLAPGSVVDFEGIVDTERPTMFPTTPRSYRKNNELKLKILDAFKTGRTNHSERAVKKRYFDAKRQLRKNLYRAPFYGRRMGSSHSSHEGLHTGGLIDTLALQTVMQINGHVDTDLPLVDAQGSTSPVQLDKEEPMAPDQMQSPAESIDCERYVFKASPCSDAHEMEVNDEPSGSLQPDCPRYIFKSGQCSESHQMEGNDEPSGSLQTGSPRYVFKDSPCSEPHQLEVNNEPTGSLQTAVLSGDQEEIISIIVGSEVPSTSAGICPQSSAVSSSSSPSPGNLDASVAVFVNKTTEQLHKMSDLILAQSHTAESHHTEILEALHGIRDDLSELRQQTQISNELQNQKRLDNKLFRDQLLQLKREKLDILRVKYGLESPSSPKPLCEQQEESSSNEDEYSCSEIKKLHKDKERFILIL